ncbi:SagB-type dehydrogenase domain protein [Thalassoporum mexicanum PCC 7367]|uniref:SagB/ThcOx family dehydrogenase n=1 Tax=Thalassoporum mexicanum TaxID=3457544 RepID=UPI00029FA165|nr:SagB/ThcOx family dehydrogenase [Pseudanabaena sp. PCC 7367]AFY71379.1 SagB-type dehydrogenase domain protein [Pseudanabaena sp. PCC 7367]
MSDLPISIAQHYHSRTKYDPEGLRNNNHRLNWGEQPSTYKEYKLGHVYDLKPHLVPDQKAEGQSLLAQRWHRLSKLLFCSYGLTAKFLTMNGDPVYLRAAPSAGALYPAEVYLISGGTALLPAGLYNYQPKNHTLVHFWADTEVWQKLEAACFQHPTLAQTKIAIATTAVFFRSAWRYQARAYRRIYLDTGHLLGNIELAAAIFGYRPYLVGGFNDDVVNELLYLDGAEEGATAIIPLLDLQENEFICRGIEARGRNLDPNSQGYAAIATSPTTAIASATHTNFPDLSESELLSYFHQATKLDAPAIGSKATEIEPAPESTSGNPEPNLSDRSKQVLSNESEPEAQSKAGQSTANSYPLDDRYNFPFCTKIAIATDQRVDWVDEVGDLTSLEDCIISRRSTRAFRGEAIELAQLKLLLDFTYQSQNYVEQGLDGEPDYFDLSLIQTFVAASAVNGLEDGCYYYATGSQELRQIRFKNFRQELHFLCLGQDLGRDAAVVMFHAADLGQAIAKYGDRAYRYLHLDAGHLGQKLNLAALKLGLGVSGIGGFFDDHVNEVLGISAEAAVLYVTTIGIPR